MKKSITTCLLSVMACFVLHSMAIAQLSVRQSAGSMDALTLNNTSVPAMNLFVVDSLIETGGGELQGGSLIHRASFEIEITSSAGKSILKAFYSAMQGQQLQNLTLSKSSIDGRSTEQREYSGIAVKEIVLSELRADSKDPARAKFIIEAQNVFLNNGSGKGFSGYEKRAGTANNFRLMMDNLPSQTVSRISSLTIVPASTGRPLSFNIDVSSQDTRQWNDWLTASATQGSYQGKNATISLMDQTGQEIFSIQLSQVRIASVSSASISNLDRGPKMTVTLRTNQDPIIN